MSDAIQIMFDDKGLASRVLHARWRAKGAGLAIPARLVCHTGGYATRQFRGVWRQAFPTREPLPDDPIATAAGTFTEEMLSIWI